MSLTAEQWAELMPDATQLESVEPEMESSLHYAQLALISSANPFPRTNRVGSGSKN